MKKEDAKALFREKFENKILKDNAVVAEFNEYLKTAIQNHQGRKFNSKIHPSDFSLQDLVFMIADFSLSKDYIEIIFKAFKDYSFNLQKDFDKFLTLLVNEKPKPEMQLHAGGLLNRFLKEKYIHFSNSLYNKHLSAYVEAIFKLIINNVSDISGLDVLLAKIHDQLIQLLRNFLSKFTSYDGLPGFLKEEVAMINAWLDKDKLELENRQNIVLDNVVTFLEEGLRHGQQAVHQGIITEKGSISLPLEYCSFCEQAIEEVLISPLKSLTKTTNPSSRLSQHRLGINKDLSKQDLWETWHEKAKTISREFLRNSTKKIVPYSSVEMDEVSKENSKIPEKELKKEAESVPLKKVGSPSKLLGQFRFSSHFSLPITNADASPTRPRSKRVPSMNFEDKENQLNQSNAVSHKNELDDTSPEEIIKEIANVKLEEPKTAINFLLITIGRIEAMQHYEQTLPAMRELYFNIKEKFPMHQQELAIINEKCNQLLQNYKELIKEDYQICQRQQGKNYLSYINERSDKKLLEIVCFLNTDLVIDAIGREAKIHTGISEILIFSQRYSKPVNDVLSLVYKDQPEKIKEYQEKLKGSIHGATTDGGIYNNTHHPIYASHFKTDAEQESDEPASESEVNQTP